MYACIYAAESALLFGEKINMKGVLEALWTGLIQGRA